MVTDPIYVRNCLKRQKRNLSVTRSCEKQRSSLSQNCLPAVTAGRASRLKRSGKNLKMAELTDISTTPAQEQGTETAKTNIYVKKT